MAQTICFGPVMYCYAILLIMLMFGHLRCASLIIFLLVDCGFSFGEF